MQRADVVASTAVAALGAFALVTALNLAFLSDSGVPGPGFFPTLLSGLLVVLGVVLGVTSLRRRPATGTGDEAEEPTAADSPSARSRVLRAGTVWVCFLIAVPILTYLGFVPAMAILIALLLFGVERRLNWRSLVVAVVVPVGVYELFVHLLSIPLPTGVIAIGPFSS
ncbi:MAG TPA: tripartite tricarboxylate transporter TctB family protein [Pseudonocardiaceae bacterium]|nr:tripartite tricarboxylate transporter TctB family protein [Pseudonocardiaceae bacterium]